MDELIADIDEDEPPPPPPPPQQQQQAQVQVQAQAEARQEERPERAPLWVLFACGGADEVLSKAHAAVADADEVLAAVPGAQLRALR